MQCAHYILPLLQFPTIKYWYVKYVYVSYDMFHFPLYSSYFGTVLLK